MIKDKKTRVLQVRMTENDCKELEAIANRIGMSTAEYVRTLLRGAIVKAKGVPHENK